MSDEISKLREEVRELKSQLTHEGDIMVLEEYGGAFTVRNGRLFNVVMLVDNTLETNNGELDWVEVTAPDSQSFLDIINRHFKTSYKMSNFSGR